MSLRQARREANYEAKRLDEVPVLPLEVEFLAQVYASSQVIVIIGVRRLAVELNVRYLGISRLASPM